MRLLCPARLCAALAVLLFAWTSCACLLGAVLARPLGCAWYVGPLGVFGFWACAVGALWAAGEWRRS